MWQHNYTPIAGSLGISAAIAAIPVVVLFVMLGVLRKPAWMSALAALVSAFLVALAVYGMPAQLAVVSTLYGAAYGLFPIAWVVFASIMLYRLAVDTGKFEIIKDSVGALTDDRRLQAMFIAFSFGAFIEGAAGFGAPVAVAGAMLAGLGFNPFYAAGICLLANTAPVAFGSIGIPVTTLAGVTGLPVTALSAMVGRLCAMISVFIPGYLIVIMAGRKRAIEVLPAIVACGVSFAGMQFFVSNYVGPELTDIMSSLTCILVMVAVLKLWKPKSIMRLDTDKPMIATAKVHSGAEVFIAWVPYLLLVIAVLTLGAPAIKAAVDRWTNGLLPSFLPKNPGTLNGLNVPGLHNLIMRVPPVVPKASTIRGSLHIQLDHRFRVGVPDRDHCRSHRARRWTEAARGDLQGHVQPAVKGDADHRVDARPGVSDELFRHDLNARPSTRRNGRCFSILQRRCRMAWRISDR